MTDAPPPQQPEASRCYLCGKQLTDGDRIYADGRVEPPRLRHRECESDRPPKPPTKRCQLCSEPVLYPGKDWSEFCATHSREPDTDDPVARAVVTSIDSPGAVEPPLPVDPARLRPPQTRAGQSLLRGKRVHEKVVREIELEAYAEGHHHATQAFAAASVPLPVDRLREALERYRLAYLRRHASNDGECEHGFGPPATGCPNADCDEADLQRAWIALARLQSEPSTEWEVVQEDGVFSEAHDKEGPDPDPISDSRQPEDGPPPGRWPR